MNAYLSQLKNSGRSQVGLFTYSVDLLLSLLYNRYEYNFHFNIFMMSGMW